MGSGLARRYRWYLSRPASSFAQNGVLHAYLSQIAFNVEQQVELHNLGENVDLGAALGEQRAEAQHAQKRTYPPTTRTKLPKIRLGKNVRFLVQKVPQIP